MIPLNFLSVVKVKTTNVKNLSNKSIAPIDFKLQKAMVTSGSNLFVN